MTGNADKKGYLFKNPHTYVILCFVLIFVTITTYIIPAGEYDMAEDEATGRMVAIQGTYHPVEQTPVGPFRMVMAIAEGMIDGADIIFLIFFAYGAVAMLSKIGAFYGGIGRLLAIFGKNDKILFVIILVICAVGGSTYGMWEEIYGLIPAFVAIAIAMGYDGLTGGAVLVLGVGTGFAAATTNPFTLGVAQGIAGVPINSGILYRCAIFVCYLAVTIWYLLRYVSKIKKNPDASLVKGVQFAADDAMGREALMALPFEWHHKLAVLVFAGGVVMLVVGTLKLGWYLNEMSALFIVMMVSIGLIGRLGLGEIADTFIKSCGDMAFGAFVVGLARSIAIVMGEGHIIHSVIYYLSGLVGGVSHVVSALGMLVVQNLVNFFIPSGSGQAAATMPLMAPLADNLGLSRQVAVLAYQFGDGFSNLFWPTAVATECAMMRIPIDKWYKFIAPLFGIWFIMQAAFVVIAVMIGYQ
ncbi:MAG: TIGR00366 family protein [Synergistaceae bacterium]|jgi:uncharacterized ion transporter superfamily protein YfcC|nr:TIGR00366 family protein [Synergistaceae bacterium]